MYTEENLVADSELVLRLIKVAYQERGVPYHFCKADYERNKIGLAMNDQCCMLCVGPHRDGKKRAIVTCGSNQRITRDYCLGYQKQFSTCPCPIERGT